MKPCRVVGFVEFAMAVPLRFCPIFTKRKILVSASISKKTNPTTRQTRLPFFDEIRQAAAHVATWLVLFLPQRQGATVVQNRLVEVALQLLSDRSWRSEEIIGAGIEKLSN
jgi:hypothetical protein